MKTAILVRFIAAYNRRRRGRVGKGVGHIAHVWSYGVRKVVSSNPDRGNIVGIGWVFHPTRWLARFSLTSICLSFQILNLCRTLSSWGSINYRPSAPLLYEPATLKNCHSGQYYTMMLLYQSNVQWTCIAMICVTKSRTGNYEFRACARARGFPGSTWFGRTHTLRRVCRAITR